MSNLKSKVGNGGIDPALLEEGEKALCETLERDGQEWVGLQLKELTSAYDRFNDPAHDRFGKVNDVVGAALDLKSLALSVNDIHLAEIARSLHLFAETADCTNPKIQALLRAHVQAAKALGPLDQRDGAASTAAAALSSELVAAVKSLM